MLLGAKYVAKLLRDEVSSPRRRLGAYRNWIKLENELGKLVLKVIRMRNDCSKSTEPQVN